MPIRTVLLIRHAQYRNTQPDGHDPDGPLTDQGREQAYLVGQRLLDLPLRAIFYSNTIRARETATSIIKVTEHEIEREVPLLREAWAGMPVNPLLPDDVLMMVKAHPERLKEGLQRVKKIERSFLIPSDQDCTDVLVCHGNLIDALVCHTIGAPWSAWLNADIRHTGISEIEIRENGLRKLVSHGDVGHLPRKLYSF